MKKLIVPLHLFCALVVLAASSLIAPSHGFSAEPLVYVVDMQKIIDESLVGKGARSNLEADLKKREAMLERRRAELQKLSEDIQKQSGLLSSAALEEKRQILVKNEREFGRLLQDQRAEAAKKNNAEMARVIKEIDAAIAEIGAAGKYPFIIEKDPRTVVYASSRIDITADVVKLLNKKKVDL